MSSRGSSRDSRNIFFGATNRREKIFMSNGLSFLFGLKPVNGNVFEVKKFVNVFSALSFEMITSFTLALVSAQQSD